MTVFGVIPLSTIVMTGLVCATGLSLQATQLSELAQIRRALGNDGQVRSLLLRGKAISGVNQVTGKPEGETRILEIKILMPDFYLREERDSLSVFRFGFAQDTLLNRWTPASPGVQIISDFPPERIRVERLHFARLIAGMIGEMKTALSLSTKKIGPNTIELRSPDGSVGMLELDKNGTIPERIRYPDKIRLVRPSSDQLRQGLPPLPEEKSVEVSLSFENRREVQGLLVPHQIIRRIGETVLDTLIFESVAVNAPLSQKDFRPTQ